MNTRLAARLLIVTILILPLFSITDSASAPLDRYHVRYPGLSVINSHNGSIWFSGRWDKRFLVVQRNPVGQWITHVCPGTHDRFQLVFQNGHRLIFLCYGPSMTFDLDSLRWRPIKEADARNLLKPSDASSSDESVPRKITVREGDSIVTYDFPLPSYNAYRRWRFNPSPGGGLEANVGDTIHLHDLVWFAIDFYAGEGTTGVGGLGVFDPRTKSFGVLRDSSLGSTSSNRLLSKGDTIFVTTALQGEGDLIDGSGLVIIDTHAGRITNANRDNSPIIGGVFNTMKLIDDYLWMLTDEAIVGWDLKRDRWCAARMDSVVTNATTPLSRRVYALRHPNDWGSVSQDSLVAVSKRAKGVRLNLKWLDYGKVEFDGESVLSGWVSKDDLEDHQRYDRDGIAGNLGLLVFADSALKVPFHYVKFGTLAPGRTFGNSVSVQVSSLWCDVRSVDPIFSIIWEDRQFIPSWRRYSDVFSEFRREQQEVLENTPVLDTTFTVRKGMDLYANFGEVVEMRWLPSDEWVDPNPNGIVFFYSSMGSSSDIKLVCSKGKLMINGKDYVPGSLWSTEAPEFKATYRFTDPKFSNSDANTLAAITIKYVLVLPAYRKQ